VLVVLGEIMYHRLHRLATHMRHVPLSLHYIHTAAALVLRQRWLTMTTIGHHDDWADTLQTAVRASSKASKKATAKLKKPLVVDDPESPDEAPPTVVVKPKPKTPMSPIPAPKTRATVFATPDSPTSGDADGSSFAIYARTHSCRVASGEQAPG